MNKSFAQSIENEISLSELKWVRLPNSDATFRSADLDRGKGFQLELIETGQRLTIEFTPESFAGDLVSAIRVEVEINSSPLRLIEKQLAETQGLTVRVNGRGVAGLVGALELGPWFDVQLSVSFSKFISAERLRSETARFLNFLVIALPTEEEDAGQIGDLEGAEKQGVFNSFERSRKNRAACISLKGTSCLVCEMNFMEKYGEIGSGYIHVHHLTPVSRMKGERPVDPKSELVPVCANCHYMLHRKDPPYTPEELMSMLGSRT